MSTFSDLADAAGASLSRASAIVQALTRPGEVDERALNSEATRLLRELDLALKKMDAEVKAAPPSSRRELSEQLATLRVSLNTARQGLQKANDARARASLMRPDKARALEEAAVDKLEAVASKSSANTQKLQAAAQQLNDTQDIGVSVITSMTAQRESLLRSTDAAGNTNALALTARGLLLQMTARALTNKILLAFTALVLLGACGVMIWCDFGGSKCGK